MTRRTVWGAKTIIAPMVNYQALMQTLSTPRPNGSAGERAVRQALKTWLEERHIPYTIHPFRHYPYFFECIGLWIILTRTLLAIAIWLLWGWAALLIALVSLPGGLVDIILHFHLITWPGACSGENLILTFEPEGGNASQEAILCAHYDSKTELLDHHQRMFFLRKLPVGIALTLILGLLGPLESVLRSAGSTSAVFVYWFGVTLTAPMLFLAWGLGLNLSVGRLLPQSQGSVDNGAACAILLGLAQLLASQGGSDTDGGLRRTRVTLAIFSGEEVNMQGSRAYARTRGFPLPAIAVNLEAMAQDGAYVFWERDGSLFRLEPTTPGLCAALSRSVQAVTGAPAQPSGPILSDGGSFLAAGVPVAVLGSYDRRLRATGFHQPTDNLQRVVIDRLEEGVDILVHFLHVYDQEGLQGPNPPAPAKE